MPVHKVGKDGYQWGTTGKVYTGSDLNDPPKMVHRSTRNSMEMQSNTIQQK